MIINTQHPYCCDECGAELGTLIMQHFSKRTIILGACTTPGCSKQHSHQAAERRDEPALERLVILEAIAAARGIEVGNYENALASVAKVGV